MPADLEMVKTKNLQMSCYKLKNRTDVRKQVKISRLLLIWL